MVKPGRDYINRPPKSGVIPPKGYETSYGPQGGKVPRFPIGPPPIQPDTPKFIPSSRIKEQIRAGLNRSKR